MRRLFRELARLLLSGVGAAALIVVGSMALFVTAYPKWVSLTVAPLSLLLTPGVAYSLVFTKNHDYTANEILLGAFVFHLVALYGLLLWWDRRAGLARR